MSLCLSGKVLLVSMSDTGMTTDFVSHIPPNLILKIFYLNCFTETNYAYLMPTIEKNNNSVIVYG